MLDSVCLTIPPKTILLSCSNVLKEIVDTERKYVEDLKYVSEVNELKVFVELYILTFITVLFIRYRKFFALTEPFCLEFLAY